MRKLAKSAAPATSKLSALLKSLDQRGGFKNLLRFVYRATGAFNGFDSIGHYLRAFLLITNCNDYVTAPQTGCIANFLPPTTTDESAKDKHAGAPHKRPQREHRKPSEPSGGHGNDNGGAQTETGPRSDQQTTPQQPQGQGNNGGQEAQPPLQTEPTPQAEPPTTTTPDDGTQPAAPDVGVNPSAAPRTEKMRDARLLMNFLVGERQRQRARGEGKR